MDSIEKIKSRLIIGDLSQNKNPFISIVIPTYKREEFLKETIESILKQEELNECEIIICDNDSDKNNTTLEKMLKEYNSEKIYYYKNLENLGMTGNWNRCIELARGTWVTMIHDDDYFLDGAIKKIKKYIKNYNIDLIHFEFIVKNELENKILIPDSEYKIEPIVDFNFLSSPQILAPVGTTFKRECALKIGGFIEEFYPSLDYEFWVRFIEKYRGIKIKGESIAVYRFSRNESLNFRTMIDCYLKNFIIRKELKNKYNFQYYISYLYNIEKFRKKKLHWVFNLTKSQKNDIENKIKYSKIKYLSLLCSKIRIFYLWKKFQKNKMKRYSINDWRNN